MTLSAKTLYAILSTVQKVHSVLTSPNPFLYNLLGFLSFLSQLLNVSLASETTVKAVSFPLIASRHFLPLAVVCVASLYSHRSAFRPFLSSISGILHCPPGAEPPSFQEQLFYTEKNPLRQILDQLYHQYQLCRTHNWVVFFQVILTEGRRLSYIRCYSQTKKRPEA